MGAFTFRVDANTVDVERYLNSLSKSMRSKVVVPALNKTARKVKTEVVRKIAKDEKKKQKPIRDQIKVRLANRATKKKKGRYYATVDASEAKTVNLIKFVTRATRKVNYFNKRIGKGKKRRYKAKGVIANTGGGRKVYKGTFIAPDSNGELKVFKRKGKARDKIYQVSGSRPGKYFRKPETHAFMRKVAEKHFPVEVKRKLNHILSKQK